MTWFSEDISLCRLFLIYDATCFQLKGKKVCPALLMLSKKKKYSTTYVLQVRAKEEEPEGSQHLQILQVFSGIMLMFHPLKQIV